jgi:hypothetical protein
MILEKIATKTEAVTQVEAEAGTEFRIDHFIACSTRETLIIGRDCLIFLESKKKMTQKHNQPSTTITVSKVNHTSHWQQPSQSSSLN